MGPRFVRLSCLKLVTIRFNNRFFLDLSCAKAVPTGTALAFCCPFVMARTRKSSDEDHGRWALPYLVADTDVGLGEGFVAVLFTHTKGLTDLHGTELLESQFLMSSERARELRDLLNQALAEVRPKLNS